MHFLFSRLRDTSGCAAKNLSVALASFVRLPTPTPACASGPLFTRMR
jgi:hypothetical protein